MQAAGRRSWSGYFSFNFFYVSFSDLNLIEPIMKALKEEQYEVPTPIQSQAIPAILQKRDVLGCAQTGTGKTAAFVIPLLQLLATNRHEQGPRRQPRVLILAPTRELALQIGESISAYGRHLPFKTATLYGGVSQQPQVDALRRGAEIVVATPGRLLDLMSQNLISLSGIQYFVLDEADRMLDMGFVRDVKKIIQRLPAQRQTLFFSATMPPVIKELADDLLKDPVGVQVAPVSATADRIGQQVYFAAKQHKQALLVHLLQEREERAILVFTEMKHVANKLSMSLVKAGIPSEAIHGNKSQNQRQAALSNFKSGKTRVLVATDIAARGIDIDDLALVINYQLPNVPETYVHRIGRTGRAGAEGIAIAFCDQEERPLLNAIQKLIRKTIPVVTGHAFENAPVERPSVSPVAPVRQGQSRRPQGKSRPAFRHGRPSQRLAHSRQG